MKNNYKTKNQRKAKKGYLEEEKTTKPTNGKKSSKPNKKQRNAQTQNSP
jgi:hypothetical protein